VKPAKARPAAKSVSFSKLFRAKRALEKSTKAKDRAEREFTALLKQSKHLSGKIATYNKHRYYVTVNTGESLWHPPSMQLQRVQE